MSCYYKILDVTDISFKLLNKIEKRRGRKFLDDNIDFNDIWEKVYVTLEEYYGIAVDYDDGKFELEDDKDENKLINELYDLIISLIDAELMLYN